MGRILGRRILKSCRADDWAEGTVQPPDVKGYRRTNIIDLNVFIDVRACHHASGDPCRWESGHGVFERIKAHRNSMVVFSGAPPVLLISQNFSKTSQNVSKRLKSSRYKCKNSTNTKIYIICSDMFRLGLESSKCPLSFFSTEGYPHFRLPSLI